jgi:hypothetical protein
MRLRGLAPNNLGREFSPLQSGFDAALKGGGPFEASHDPEQRPWWALQRLDGPAEAAAGSALALQPRAE